MKIIPYFYHCIYIYIYIFYIYILFVYVYMYVYIYILWYGTFIFEGQYNKITTCQ